MRCTTTGPGPPGLAEGGPQRQGDVHPSPSLAVCVQRNPRSSHRAAASPCSAPRLHGGSPQPLQPGNNPRIMGAGSEAVGRPHPSSPCQGHCTRETTCLLLQGGRGRNYTATGGNSWGTSLHRANSPAHLCAHSQTRSPKACRCVPGPSPPLPQVMLPVLPCQAGCRGLTPASN